MHQILKQNSFYNIYKHSLTKIIVGGEKRINPFLLHHTVDIWDKGSILQSTVKGTFQFTSCYQFPKDRYSRCIRLSSTNTMDCEENSQ